MNWTGRLMSVLWATAIGLVVLYLFLFVLDAFEPNEAWPLTIGVLVLVVLLVIHYVRLHRELDSEGPNPARRELNRWRERRGF